MPSGFAIHAHDVLPPLETWQRRFHNVTHCRLFPPGEQFVPFECPNSYARELIDFTRSHRPTA